MVIQKEFALPPFNRGFHLITSLVLDAVGQLPENGIFHLFLKHTSAGLTINENCDSDVLLDFESVYNRLIPEGLSFLRHTLEGLDDMPAHIKSTLTGQSISIPITKGKLNLGIWQGIYLCEFRNKASDRNFVATIFY